jgi:hypothetical protein
MTKRTQEVIENKQNAAAAANLSGGSLSLRQQFGSIYYEKVLETRPASPYEA